MTGCCSKNGVFSATDDAASPASAPVLAVTPIAPYMLGKSVVGWVVAVELTTPLPPSISILTVEVIGCSGVNDASPAGAVLGISPPAESNAASTTNAFAWLLVSILGGGGEGWGHWCGRNACWTHGVNKYAGVFLRTWSLAFKCIWSQNFGLKNNS